MERFFENCKNRSQFVNSKQITSDEELPAPTNSKRIKTKSLLNIFNF